MGGKSGGVGFGAGVWRYCFLGWVDCVVDGGIRCFVVAEGGLLGAACEGGLILLVSEYVAGGLIGALSTR